MGTQPVKAAEDLLQNLQSAGFLGSIISASKISEVEARLAALAKGGVLDRGFFSKRLAHYDFRLPSDFHQARSVIVAAVRQPRIRVGFMFSGKAHSFIIPPTYDYSTDVQALDIIEASLGRYGFTARDAVLPWKALAVRSGLASYGRNNIAYVDGWGSLVRLRGFYSDLPPPNGTWRSPVVMERCSECVACHKACPSGAITDDRSVIRAERCITFFNEETDDFPEWIDPGWHTCLVGCMICQDVCPANKPLAAYEVKRADFSEEETLMLLDAVPQERLPLQTFRKLKTSTLLHEYDVLPRNLAALLRRGGGNTA